MPSLTTIKKHGLAFTPLDHALFIAERIGGIPTDRYTDRHHKKIGDSKTNAVESIELATLLIEAMLTIQDADIKALTVMMLIELIPLLEEWRDGIDREEDEAIGEDYDKKILNTAQSYGIDTSLISRAFELRNAHLEKVKPQIDKIMKDKGDTPTS